MAKDSATVVARVGLDDTGFQQGVTKIQRSLKVVKSEFAAASSKLGDFGKSTEGLKLKADSLSKQMELQKQKVAALTRSYEESVDKKGADAKATENLRIRLNYATADMNRLEHQLNETNESIRVQESRWTKLGDKLSNAGEKMQKAGGKMQNVGKKMTKATVGIATAVTGAGVAMFGMATKAAESTDRIDKLSQKIGISRTGFQEWDFILSQSGTDIEKMQTGLKTLVERMDQSAQGTGKGAEAFNQLGLSATDLDGKLKSQELMFEETVKKLQEIPEGAEKSKLAFDLFGKAGLELMPLLNSAGGSVDDLKNKAKELGIVLSDDAIDAGVQFTDQMDQMKRSLGSMATQIGVAAMPMFMDLSQYIMDNMPQIQATASKAFKVIGEVVSFAGSMIKALVPILSEMWQVAQPTIERLAVIVKNASDKFNNMSDSQKETIAKIGLLIVALGPAISILGKLISIGGTVVSTFGTISKAVGAGKLSIAALSGPIGIAIAAITAIIAIGVLLYKNWDTIKAKADALKNSIIEKWNNIKNTTKSTWNNVKTAILSPIIAAKDGVKNTIDKILGFFKNLKIPEIKIPKIKLPHFNLKGDFSLNPPSVPKLAVNWYAKGGIFNAPSVIGVGEAGTEAVLPIDRLDELIARAIKKAQGLGKTDGLSVHIENFINNTEKDIEQLAYELEFYRQRIAMGKGGN